jgi:phage shock protein A
MSYDDIYYLINNKIISIPEILDLNKMLEEVSSEVEQQIAIASEEHLAQDELERKLKDLQRNNDELRESLFEAKSEITRLEGSVKQLVDTNINLQVEYAMDSIQREMKSERIDMSQKESVSVT